MILLSYIIPLYNSSRWLSKCLDSVLNQDIDESQVEIICINDGSPDNSPDIVRLYQKEHSCIVLIHQENQGPSGARNNGMRYAGGKYLAFVDPDDFVEPNVYGGLIKQMEDEQLDMLRFNFQMVDEKYRLLEKPISEKLFDYSPHLMSGPEFLGTRLGIACNIWRYLYKTDVIVKNNIWCYQGDYYDDTPWLPLVLMKAKRVNVCDTVVYDYLERGDSLVKSSTSSSVNKKIAGYDFLLDMLIRQRNALEEYLPEVCESVKTSVYGWYRNMESHSAYTLLSLTAVYRFGDRHKCICKIKDLGIFPLQGMTFSKKNRRKQFITNFSPLLMMWLLKISWIMKSR